MRNAFSYAILRVIPDLERGECLNAGVVVHCRQQQFLEVRVELDEARLRALDPHADAAAVAAHLDAVAGIARGDATCGPIAGLPQPERFGWIVAPSSTIVQASAVHTGLCTDAAQTLGELFERLVAVSDG